MLHKPGTLQIMNHNHFMSITAIQTGQFRMKFRFCCFLHGHLIGKIQNTTLHCCCLRSFNAVFIYFSMSFPSLPCIDKSLQHIWQQPVGQPMQLASLQSYTASHRVSARRPTGQYSQSYYFGQCPFRSVTIDIKHYIQQIICLVAPNQSF